MVNKKAFSDGGPGMNLYPCKEAGDMGEEAGRKAKPFVPEPMAKPMGKDGVKAWITQ